MLKVICLSTHRDYQRWLKHSHGQGHALVIDLNTAIDGFNEGDRADFLKAYVEVVGQLSAHSPSLLWWATDISSKNRFFSPLVDPLEKFFKIMRILKRSAGGEGLIFIGVPWVLQESVEALCADQGFECYWPFRLRPRFIYLKQVVLKAARVLRHVIYILPRISYARRVLGKDAAQAASDKTPVYVFKTFVAARAFDRQGTYKDLFFGAAVDHVARHQRVLVLGDVMDDFKKTTDLLGRVGGARVFPLESFLSPMDVLRASWQILTYCWQIPSRVDFCGQDITPLMVKLRESGADKIQPLHLYQYYVTRALLKQFSVKSFALTCEFNPWEKMCLWAVRELSPQTKTIGYQHAVVPQASANMFTSRLEEGFIPRPDLVLTVGQAPKDIIHRYETCAPSTVKACSGLRFDYLSGQPQPKRENRGHILLALEGLPQVAEMTNYVLGHWDGAKDWQLRIRTHPVLPLEKFVSQLTKDPLQMKGVSISKGTSLKDDLLWSDMVIYWGTTVALEVVSLGKPVIHYDNGFLLSYDPLFELKDFHWVATSSTSLIDIINHIYALSSDDYERQCKAAQAYMAGYFHLVNSTALDCFL